jgi:hypothetical protein
MKVKISGSIGTAARRKENKCSEAVESGGQMAPPACDKNHFNNETSSEKKHVNCLFGNCVINVKNQKQMNSRLTSN